MTTQAENVIPLHKALEVEACYSSNFANAKEWTNNLLNEDRDDHTRWVILDIKVVTTERSFPIEPYQGAPREKSRIVSEKDPVIVYVLGRFNDNLQFFL